MNIGHVMFLEYAGFIVAALASYATVVSIAFAIISIFSIIWFKKVARDIARKKAQQAVAVFMESIKKRVEDAVYYESREPATNDSPASEKKTHD